METNNPITNPVLHRIHRIVANVEHLDTEFRAHDDDVTELDLAVIAKVDELLTLLRANATARAELARAAR